MPPHLVTPDGAQGEHASLPLVCNGNPRQIHLQLHTLPLLSLLTQQLLFLPEGVDSGSKTGPAPKSFYPCLAFSSPIFTQRIPALVDSKFHPSSSHLFNSATSWAFISARVWFSCSSSSSSLEGCFVIPAVESSSSPSSSSPELRLAKQSQELGYFPGLFPWTPRPHLPGCIPSSPDVQCLCLFFQLLGHISPKFCSPV